MLFCFIFNCFTQVFISKSNSSRDFVWTISSFEVVSAVAYGAKLEGCHDPNIFFWIAAHVADAAAVSPNSIKKLLANGASTRVHFY